MTPEQEKVLAEVYNLKEGAELTSEEIDKAIEMFSSPESFIILRKVLGIASYADRGITIPNPALKAGSTPEDYEEYGKKVAIEILADEKIRQTLFAFYKQIQSFKIKEKRKEFETENAKKEEEDKIAEELNKVEEKNKRVFGDNI
jgi:hypothetical protein